MTREEPFDRIWYQARIETLDFCMHRVLFPSTPKYSASPKGLFATGLGSKSAVVLTAVLVLVIGLKAPNHNWDIVAYTAAAYNLDGLRGVELQSATFTDLARELTPTEFQQARTGFFNATFFNDPNSLEQNLPFYTVKIVYLELMRLLKHAGVSYPIASYAISAVFASLSIFLIASLSAHFGVSLFWTPVFAAFAGFHSLSRYSTPDALACFFALLSVYLFLKNSKSVYILAVLMPLIRTDLILLSLILMSSLYYVQRTNHSILIGISSLISYFGVSHFSGNYGYLVLFNYAFIGQDPYPRDMSLSMQPWAYVMPYIDCARLMLFHERHTLAYALALYLICISKSYKPLDGLPIVTAIASSYALLHIALFPHYEERFFAFPVSIICVLLMAMLQKRFQVAFGKGSISSAATSSSARSN